MTAQTTESAATLRSYVALLNRAIARGVRSVTLGEQTVIYNTTDSLISARNDMLKQLRAAEAAEGITKRASRQTYAVFGGRDY